MRFGYNHIPKSFTIHLLGAIQPFQRPFCKGSTQKIRKFTVGMTSRDGQDHTLSAKTSGSTQSPQQQRLKTVRVQNPADDSHQTERPKRQQTRWQRPLTNLSSLSPLTFHTDGLRPFQQVRLESVTRYSPH